jgi:thiol:disulfide interchange protein
MKRNLHLILLLILALVGLAVFKISLSKSQAEVVQAEPLPVELSGYVNYSEAALAAALAKGKAVLFFAATTWCQTCSALEAEIIARASEIPAYTTILKVDYTLSPCSIHSSF